MKKLFVIVNVRNEAVNASDFLTEACSIRDHLNELSDDSNKPFGVKLWADHKGSKEMLSQ